MSIRCRCDGRYDGCTHGVTCDAPGGGRWSPYFCAECDPRRVEHISIQFEKLKMTFSDEDKDHDRGRDD